MDKDILLKKALELKALEYGDFTLTSGKKSNFYFDGRRLTLNPECSIIISNWVINAAKKLKLKFIGGPVVAAVPIIGSIVYASSLLNYPINGFFIRSSKKEHGLQKQIEGNFKPNSDVIIIDDTISTGGSLIESIKIVQQQKSNVKLVLSILDRKMGGSDKIKQLGYNFNSIFSITDKGEIE